MLLRSGDPLRDVAALFPKMTLPLGLDAYLNYLYDAATDTLRLNSAGGILPRQKQSLMELRPGESLCGECARSRKTIVRPALQAAVDPSSEPMRRLGFASYVCFPLQIENRLLGTLAFASSYRPGISGDEVECLSIVAQYVAIAIDRALREQALREIQQKLREHAEGLETKVEERTARLHETISQLESFSYTVAHDLRAPIRSLTGYGEILLSDFELPAGARTVVERLQRASGRLDALTRDLLKFSRISTEELQFEQISVAEVIEDILLLTPSLRTALRLEGPIGSVWAQRTLLQQCISNLFDNAVKFAAPERPLRIVVRAETVSSEEARTYIDEPGFTDAKPGAPPAGRRVRIWVEDNGIGIRPEAQSKIFGVFERGVDLEHIDGTGIGLAIVARAVRRMHGSCGVESALGRGSRFWLELPDADDRKTGPDDGAEL